MKREFISIVRLSEAEKQDLRDKAEAQGKSMSSFVRELIKKAKKNEH